MDKEKKDFTLEERFKWVEDNPPKGFVFDGVTNWPTIAKEIKNDMYSFYFNHPYYCGPVIQTDDELRHILLDELDVPRKKFC
jgi:hypothetical protein